MRLWGPLIAFCLCATAPSLFAATDGERWWAHVRFLADDRLQGRDAASEGYRAAARYVADAFRRAGLRPAGTDGYLQPIRFAQRRIVETESSLALVRDGRRAPLELGEDATISMRVDPAPAIDAPLAFAGYGLRIPELHYDDLADVDVKGKVAVYVAGAPASLSGPLVSHYESARERWRALRSAGVIGSIAIQHPRGTDVPWHRSKLARLLPSLSLADTALDDIEGQQLHVTFNPERAAKLFEGSGHEWDDVAELARRSERLPRFPLPSTIAGRVVVQRTSVESPNVVGLLPGGDLKNEFVVVTAHLDHVGVGEPAGTDRIYNGAMDNASGVATLIEVAATLQRGEAKRRRSIVFAALTAEEKGLLGSRYYAARPTVPAGAIVANLNTDMFLPLFPFKSVIALGADESDLEGDVRRVAEETGIAVIADPEPERNSFTRSDQYSFIRRGIPALALKVGYVKGSPQHETIRQWRRDRYHAPSDDLGQPVDLQAAADFNRLYARLVEQVATRPTRPRWNDASFFRQFAQK